MQRRTFIALAPLTALPAAAAAAMFAPGPVALVPEPRPAEIPTPQQQLEELVKIQSMDGNWNHAPYMHGLLNGMVLALAIIKGEEPVFVSPPECWKGERDGPPAVFRRRSRLTV